MEFIGNEIGGRWFDRSLFKGTMLSFGVGEDISFELEAIKAGVKVYLFDPTPKAVKFMKQYDIPFFDIGLSDKNGVERFYYPQNADHVSCSAVNLQGTADYFVSEVIDLYGACALSDVNLPDIVSMNIEGSEYKVLDWMIQNTFCPPVLLVEFHPNQDQVPYIEFFSGLYGNTEFFNNQYLFYGTPGHSRAK